MSYTPQKMNDSLQIAVVGGGAAGIFAAIRAADLAQQKNIPVKIQVYEASSRFLTKVLISGGGRCNVTYHTFDPKVFCKSYPRGDVELISPMYQFQAKDTVEWFESRGVEIKVEDDGRMFPTTDHSSTIANALLDEAEKFGVELLARKGVESIKFKNDKYVLTFNGGVSTSVDRVLIATGSSPVGYKLARSLGHTIEELAGFMGVADPIKETTAEAIEALHKDHIRIIMMTGDNETTAKAVAKKLGIDDVIAGVLPEQKAQKIKELQSQGLKVAMAGDGINDAPALAQADVGIAMGTGTDVAMESASVTLVKGDLRGIVRARQLSRATMRNIKQNLFFAFGYNMLGVPIAAGILYPTFGILLSPMIAALAMSLSSVSVITNALRLRKEKI